MLEPRTDETLLEEWMRSGESPYFAMYKAGVHGIPIEKVVARLQQIGTPIREKDVRNWQDGWFAKTMRSLGIEVDRRPSQATPGGKEFEDTRLSDYPQMSTDWCGCERRFFPCTQDNRPMQKWGWTQDFSPTLYDEASARALSPCGWVGQNMLYQRFIVLDIDGRGHGEDDEEVIAFGRRWSDRTLTYEDPRKPGSFHLYFRTDRLIPVRHFPYAKLDLMGNAVNAAVYLKDKQPNGIPMAVLTEDAWQQMIEYERGRKQR